MCGEVKSKEKEKTSSTPLVTVSDLQRLKQFEIIAIRLRMMPFKTQFTPDFKLVMNGTWGKQYPKATYPVREKKEVQLFDIREFVKAKKKEKMDEMMKNAGGDSPSPFGGPPMGGSPFGSMPGMGGSPFGGSSLGSSPFGGGVSSPFGGGMSSPFGGLGLDDKSSKGDKSESFNVDDLVKKIDAKIAELEEEERREKEEAEKKKETVIEAELDNKDDKKLYDEGTFGDDFFNDFFSDD